MSPSFTRRANQNSDRVTIDLPVTPMLDMAFQLMAFFILTFRMPSHEEQIAINMPAGPGCVLPVDTSDFAHRELYPRDFKLVLTDKDGVLDTVTVIDITNGERSAVAPASKQLYTWLSEVVVLAGQERPTLSIEVSSALRYGELMRVMDECLAAGYRPTAITMPKS